MGVIRGLCRVTGIQSQQDQRNMVGSSHDWAAATDRWRLFWKGTPGWQGKATVHVRE